MITFSAGPIMLIAVVATHLTWALLAAVLVVATILGGVMLPAVWMDDPDRRHDARRVLAQVLAFILELLRPRGQGPQ